MPPRKEKGAVAAGHAPSALRVSPRHAAPPQRAPSAPEPESSASADGTDEEEEEEEEVVEVALPPTAFPAGKQRKQRWKFPDKFGGEADVAMFWVYGHIARWRNRGWRRRRRRRGRVDAS